MTIKNAIRKLEKSGFDVMNNNKRYWAIKNHEVIDFMEQDGNVFGVTQRNENDHDDVMTDYFAGVHCDNIAQAIELAMN